MVEVRPIKIDTPDYDVLVRINNEAFPLFERDDPRLFFDSGKGFENEPLGIFLDDVFVGYIVLWHGKSLSYIAVFAISARWRGKGVGTAVLKSLSERCGERCILLCAEQPDPQADNALQRQKRIEFYTRCGFKDTQCVVGMYGLNLMVLSSTGEYPAEEFQLLLNELDNHFKANVIASVAPISEG